jgi:hypothetical protein
MDGLIWVVEGHFHTGDWRPFKMYVSREDAERKMRRLQQFESASNWRVSCYARHPECKVA